MTNYTQYRFTTAGGKVHYAFVKDGDIADLKAKMRAYAATKAEPVAGSCPIPETGGGQ